MERDEAARGGLDLFTPEELDVERWARGGADPPTLLGNVLSRALHLMELAPAQLALAGQESAGVVRGVCALLEGEGWSFQPGEQIVYRLRKCKTPEQLEGIRLAANGAGAALRLVGELLAAASERDGELWLGAERLRVARLRREIASVMPEHGLEQPDGNIVAPGADGAVPHSIGDDQRVLVPRESLVVDLYPRGELFADCTRTFCVGEPPEPLAAAHAAVVEALALARERTRPGIRGWDLQRNVCRHFEAAGYPTPISHRGTTRGYVHGLGHGVGYEVHEEPSFKEEAGDDGLLEAGDVVTLEPGLYEPEAGWAVRLEDLYALGEDGVENLTPLPTELDPRAW
ncbi:MAG: aminopeptidase P family protein [bacterium]|nr:aminopeptidase P family protein [bacterium]